MSSHAFALANSALLDAAVAPSTLRTYNKNLEQFLTHTRRPLQQIRCRIHPRPLAASALH